MSILTTEQMKEKYVNEIKTVYKERDKIEITKKLLLTAEESNLPLFSLYFQGYIDYLEGNYSKAIDKYNNALKIDSQFSCAYHGLGHVYRMQEKFDEAIEVFEKAIYLDPAFVFSYYALGVVYLNKKDYEKAELWYKKAVEVNPTFPDSYYGLGNIKIEFSEYEEAVTYYQKAVDLDSNASYLWHGLGFLEIKRNQFDKAEQYFNKALELEPEYYKSLNGLGVVFWERKDYDKAIEYFNHVIRIKPNEPLAYSNLGKLYFNKLKKYKEAQVEFSKALDLYREIKDNFRISLIERQLEEVNKAIESEAALKGKKTDPIQSILKATIEEGIEELTADNKKNFLDFVEEKPPIEEQKMENYFEVLRRWNSYTPIVADNQSVSKGGGYFLKWNGKGIVIDPGFNFIDNFKRAGHKFYEIDYVLISHAHNDHAADLESIITLLHKYNQEIIETDVPSKQERTIRGVLASRRNESYYDVPKELVEAEFAKSRRRKTIELFITASTFQKYSGLFNLYSSRSYKIHIVEKGNDLKFNDFEIEVIEAKHDDLISDRDSVGFILNFKNVSLIYTGDTGWSDKIEKQYEQIAIKYENKFKLLLAHLGGFKHYEKNYLTGNTEDKTFYQNHLGRLGLAKLNSVLKPQVCIISEFGEEINGHRIKLANIFGRAFKKVKFFPADIGLTINLTNPKIKAINGINTSLLKITDVSWISLSKIKVCKIFASSSLHYYNRKSDFTKDQLVQVLMSCGYNNMICKLD